MHSSAAVYFTFVILCIPSVYNDNYKLCSRGCSSRICREFYDGCWCVCDDICSYYGDCCYNVSVTPRNLTNQDMHLINGSTCQAPLNTYLDNHWAIATCPGNWSDDEIKQLCENTHVNISHLNLIQHVFYISQTNVSFIFKNKFCAICNGIENFVSMEFSILDITSTDCDLFTFKENLKTVPDDALRLLIVGGCPYHFNYWDANELVHYRFCHCNLIGLAPKASLSVLFNFLPSDEENSITQEV